MLNTINKGYKDILRLFYTERTKLHLRDIAKRTKLNENSAYRFLNVLEKEKILKSEKQGNLKLFSLRKNKQIYAILAFFDVEKYQRLFHLRKTAISAYMKYLPKQPVFAILFGSTAKETYRKDSDIDILLISNEKINTKKAEESASALSTLKVSTFQMTYKNFLKEVKMKEDPVVQSAIFSGYPLINHIYYYEVLNYE
jgi:predicted nucleotidyltransferase